MERAVGVDPRQRVADYIFVQRREKEWVDILNVVWSEDTSLCGFWNGSCENGTCGAGIVIQVFSKNPWSLKVHLTRTRVVGQIEFFLWWVSRTEEAQYHQPWGHSSSSRVSVCGGRLPSCSSGKESLHKNPLRSSSIAQHATRAHLTCWKSVQQHLGRCPCALFVGVATGGEDPGATLIYASANTSHNSFTRTFVRLGATLPPPPVHPGSPRWPFHVIGWHNNVHSTCDRASRHTLATAFSGVTLLNLRAQGHGATDNPTSFHTPHNFCNVQLRPQSRRPRCGEEVVRL